MRLVLLLTACELVAPLLGEVREDPTEVALSGWVWAGPFPQSADEVLTGAGAAVTALDPADGEGVLAEGFEPYADSPGYWSLTLAPEADFLLRVDGGEGFVPTLWRGRAPPYDGLLPSEAALGEALRAGVFGVREAEAEAVFQAVAEAEGLTLAPLAEGERCHLWGGPLDRDALRGDALAVVDGEGRAATVFAYMYDAATGGLIRTSGLPVDMFFAFNLAPGAVLVEVDGVPEATTRYLARGGDLVSPWFFSGSP